jgi:hypothetical protein
MEKTMIMKRVFTRMLAVAGMMAAFGPAVNAEKTELSVPDGMEGWTVINANNDDFQWAYNADKSGAVLPQNTKMAANDWIISPVVNLSGGITYRIKSWIQNLTTFSSDKQQYEITVGHAPTAEAQTTQLFKEESFTKTSWPVERPEGDKGGVHTRGRRGLLHRFPLLFEIVSRRFFIPEIHNRGGFGAAWCGDRTYCYGCRRGGAVGKSVVGMAVGKFQRV